MLQRHRTVHAMKWPDGTAVRCGCKTVAVEFRGLTMMTVRRCSSFSGSFSLGGAMESFDASGQQQSLSVLDDDTGSLITSPAPLPLTKTRSAGDFSRGRSTSSSAFVDQRLRLLLYILFSLLPSVAVTIALFTWTYASAQVSLEMMAEMLMWCGLQEHKFKLKWDAKMFRILKSIAMERKAECIERNRIGYLARVQICLAYRKMRALSCFLSLTWCCLTPSCETVN